MKNKTIKKLTKGIVAIALTIATVVGAGLLCGKQYNAEADWLKGKTMIDKNHDYITLALTNASNNSAYSNEWQSMSFWALQCYCGTEMGHGMLRQNRVANPNAEGEDGIAQYVITIGAPNTNEQYMNWVEQVILGNGICLNYVEQFRTAGDVHANYQLPAKYAKTVQNTSTTTATMIDNFDATFYANMYPDVKKAIGTDTAKLYAHYIAYGKAEGRYANQSAYNAAHKSK